MVSLVLNRRLNYRNIQLTSDTKNQHVGYDAGDGEAKYVRWLGFIERHEARRLAGARPVRLVCISQVGFSDVAPGKAVHGCLTAEGAYAVYDARVAFVTAERDEKRRTFTHAMCRSTLAPGSSERSAFFFMAEGQPRVSFSIAVLGKLLGMIIHPLSQRCFGWNIRDSH